MAVTARRVDWWAPLVALAVVAALIVASRIADLWLTVTTAPVEVQFSNLSPGWHRVVISAENGYRRVLTTGIPTGSFGDDNVPIGVVEIEVEGICTLETALGRGGVTAEINGVECSI